MDDSEATALLRRLQLMLVENGAAELLSNVADDDLEPIEERVKLHHLIDDIEAQIVHMPRMVALTMERLGARTLAFVGDDGSDATESTAYPAVLEKPSLTRDQLGSWLAIASEAEQLVHELRRIAND